MGYKYLCHRCRKVFYVGDMGDYVYKRNGHYFCSWSCMRWYDQEQERIRREKRKESMKRGKK